jgi:hypothetical protein
MFPFTLTENDLAANAENAAKNERRSARPDGKQIRTFPVFSPAFAAFAARPFLLCSTSSRELATVIPQVAT